MEAFIIGLLSFCLCLLQATYVTARKQPNFVILLMDDVGYGDITSFWNPINLSASTPFIDFMAANGIRVYTFGKNSCGFSNLCICLHLHLSIIRFTDFNSAASTCTPSRASLLTARLGARTGITKVLETSTFGGLPINETTFGETFSKAGYKTGMIGKWHMGVRREYHPYSKGKKWYSV
ncbi:Arylsulfatase G [Holothuria leucospilota]|uniref:Arylsulfatase G n=1 Tax=Holothuria leucospilota TaxID=206669 RepID=A0A9Q1H6E2_HOLLE|nr:Arylsulfatase G [Holothuria leucospilota]